MKNSEMAFLQKASKRHSALIMCALFAGGAGGKNKTADKPAGGEAPVVNMPAPAEKAAPQSEELTKLRDQLKADKVALQSVDPDNDAAYNVALEAVTKTRGLIRAEEARIVKAEKDQEIQLLKNERIAKLQNVVNLALANGQEDPAFKQAFDEVANELTARYATSSPAKSSGGGGGQTSTQIKERLLFHIASGKTTSEAKKLVEGEGFARGTTGSVATAMIKAGEITA